uniref:Receptor protein serine/threonine kinase n=1 Tax=Opuntia streptacantha TaxID=393608 RepID=A0A7C9DZV3_OPUST
MAKSQIRTSRSPLILKLKFLLLAWLHRDRRNSRVQILEHISYRDLKSATDGFRRIITVDPQGTTYEAKFQDGSLSVVREVMVNQGVEVFYKEMLCLARLHHRHIVALRGYSVGHRRFLIFKGTAHGSLKEHLNDPLRTPLNWRNRVQIAIGVAAALEYLHRFCDPPISSVSISSSDIILDEKLTPKLSNISCHCSESLRVKAIEQSKERKDLILHQFGTLMLELITGQSSINESTDLMQLIDESPLNISMDNLIDPDLGNNYNFKELRSLLSLARLCMKTKNKSTFSISHVFLYLPKAFDKT